MVAPPRPRHNRTLEWQACCHDILMGRQPKRQRLDWMDDTLPTNDDVDELTQCAAAPGYLAIDLTKQNHMNSTNKTKLDSWMEAALAMSASIDSVVATIQQRAVHPMESMEALNICFHHNDSHNTIDETEANRSILETTVASFAAGMAKQIDSLRQTIPTLEADGPMGHRANIATCLMQRLKLEVMEPMTRKRSMNENVVKMVRSPLLRFGGGGREERGAPPAPWEIGEHDSEREKKEGVEERNEFINVYGKESTNEGELSHSLEEMKMNLLPPSSVVQLLNLPRSKSGDESSIKSDADAIKPQQKSMFSFPSKQPTKATIIPDYLQQTNEEQEEQTTHQLQKEATTLLATYQNADLTSIQNVERSMTEITTLVSRFTDLIVEQQENVVSIHDQAVRSKENVEKGQDQLVDAAKRGEKTRHSMAWFIVGMALLLLLFNWILP